MMTMSGAPFAAPPPSPAPPFSVIPRPFAPQARVVPRHETLGRIVTAQAHEVYAHRRLDERGEVAPRAHGQDEVRSEEHTSELQSRQYLVCRLLLEKKNDKTERRAYDLLTAAIRPGLTGTLTFAVDA